MAVSFLFLCVLFCGNFSYGDEYAPVGPNATVAFEKSLFDLLPVYAFGVWPRIELYEKGSKPASHYISWVSKWVNRIVVRTPLKKDDFAKVKGGEFDNDEDLLADDWRVCQELRFGNDFIVGHLYLNNPLITSKKMEFQVDTEQLILVASSEKFRASSYNDQQIRKFLGQLLKIPEEVIPELKIESQNKRLEDSGIVITYGEATWKFDKMNPTSTNDRRWWSYMPFWIANGKLCVAVSVRDWEADDRPMETPVSRFRD